MTIEILGTGCAKCKQLEKNVLDALARTGKFAEVKKVEDLGEIMGYGVMSTPGLVIDGRVVSSGRLLSPDQITELIA